MQPIFRVTLIAGLLTAGLANAAAEAPPAHAPVRAPAAGSGLTGDVLYRYLLGEIAAQRGEPGLGGELFYGLARASRDPRVARRAAELMLGTRNPEQAVPALKLWRELDPKAEQPGEFLALVLTNAGRYDAARPYWEQWLRGGDARRTVAFLSLVNLASRARDKQAALELVQSLARFYPDDVTANLAVAQTALNAGALPAGLAAVRHALALAPANEHAAQLEGLILEKQQSRAAALAFYRDFLARNPKAHEVRLLYAKGLVADGQYTAARDEFNRLLAAQPKNPNLELAVGILSEELKDPAASERHFRRAMALGYEDPDIVRLYLGELAEQQQHLDEAAGWYRQVVSDGHRRDAQLRLARVASAQGRRDEALAVLKKLPAATEQQQVELVLAQSQVLRDGKDYQAALRLVDGALREHPGQPDLLYESAMLADQLGRMDVFEKQLRELIRVKPDSAQALNALGYTLADKTNRYQEAFDLVSRANALAPNDPMIMDSMGWAEYRLGHLEAARGWLEKSWDASHDAEVGAHFGEVLWASDRHGKALDVWREARRRHPDDAVLRDTMRKYGQ